MQSGQAKARSSSSPMTELMIALEERLRRVMLASDVESLASLIADHVVFTDPHGRLVSKAEDLEGHRSGRLKLMSMEASEQTIGFAGAVAIVSVRMALDGRFDGVPISGDYRYLRVWAPEGGGSGCWQVVAGHVTRIVP